MTEKWGKVEISSRRDPLTGRDTYRVEHADPTALFHNATLTEALVQGDRHPMFEIVRPEEGHGSTGHMPGRYDCKSLIGRVCFANNIVKITGENASYIYEISEYYPEHDAWLGSWPD